MVSACCLSLSDTGICSIFHTCPSSVSSRGPSFRREIQGHCDAGMVSLMINAFHFLLGRRPDLRGGMRTSLFIFGLLFSFAASAQTYPVSGVWVAMDYRFPQFRAGACLTLKTFGVDALFEGSFPTVTIFSDGQRFVVKGGRPAERAIRSVKSLADGSFRITESLGKHGSWFPWFKNQSFYLKIVDPMIIELTEGTVSTRFFKCSSGRPSL